MVEITDGILTASISEKGAELKSLKKDGKELIWCADPAVWGNSCPVLFPLCGGLKEDKFIYEGSEYILGKHGFARGSIFKAEEVGKDSAVFLLASNADTLQSYPFEFELRVKFRLENGSLSTTYEVKNPGKKTMYFSVGAHEGYACPEGIEEYSVVFEQEEDFLSTELNGNLLEYKQTAACERSRTIDLKYDYFAVDALVFTGLKSRSAALKNNRTGSRIDLSFDGFDYFLLWTKPGAKYICLEPWCGIPDYIDSDYDITKKPGINALAAGEVFSRVHVITPA